MTVACACHFMYMPFLWTFKSWEFYSTIASTVFFTWTLYTCTHTYSYFNISFIFLLLKCVHGILMAKHCYNLYFGLGGKIKSVMVLHCFVQEKLLYLLFFDGC